MSNETYDVIIIGAGAAGCSAAIYAKRYGLSTLVLEKAMAGGTAAEAPVIENYPGFDSIGGMDLMEKMKAHARRYVTITEMTDIGKLTRSNGAFLLEADAGAFEAHSVILATGSSHRMLDVKGEKAFTGKGVSYCATCDGFFFKDKRVAVIGGGNTAAIEALHLRALGAEVMLVHRRDELRAEKALQDKLFNQGVTVAWDSVVDRIIGDQTVTAVALKNTKTDAVSDHKVDGVFIAVGEAPRNALAIQIGAAVDGSGYVVTDKGQRTNVPHFYAAGDVTGGLRQVITACAEGAVAANSAHGDME